MFRPRRSREQDSAANAAELFVRAGSTLALWGCFVVCLTVVFGSGCGEGFANQTASLGRARAGQRGQVKIVFINNTPDRAVFSYGMFDQLDRDSIPNVRQFGINDFETTIDGGMESDIVRMACGRVFSVGSQRLLDLVARNGDPSSLLPEALEPGVRLFRTDQAGAGEPVLEGSAEARELLLGVDFNCESLLIFRIETNDVGDFPFRVDFEVAPAESTR
ncbi:MAG: hypothetical protein ACE5E5_01850 [Phycisphaerae bacterium]